MASVCHPKSCVLCLGCDFRPTAGRFGGRFWWPGGSPGRPRNPPGAAKRNFQKKTFSTNLSRCPKCGQSIVNNVSVAHSTFCLKKCHVLRTHDLLCFKLILGDAGPRPGARFGTLGRHLAPLGRQFLRFLGVRSVVRSTIAVLMAKVSEIGRLNVAKP